jgi:hypothetical protein
LLAKDCVVAREFYLGFTYNAFMKIQKMPLERNPHLLSGTRARLYRWAFTRSTGVTNNPLRQDAKVA